MPPRRLRPDRARGRRLQLHPQQRQDHRRRLRRHDALLRQRPGRPDHPRLPGRLPRRCSSRCRPMPADLRAHLRVPEDLFNVQTSMFGRYHVTNAQQFFRRGRPVDGADPDERADAAVRGVLRRDAAAERGRGRVPAAPADGPDRPPEHDRLGRGPDGRAELRAGPGLSLPGGHDGLRAGPDRGPDRPGPAHQRPGLALEPVGQQGHPRQPDRRARSTTR